MDDDKDNQYDKRCVNRPQNKNYDRDEQKIELRENNRSL